MEHRYTGTGLYRPEGEYVATGDTITPTEPELQAFGDTLDPVAQTESKTPDTTEEAAPEAGDDTEPPVPFEGYEELTVGDLRDEVGDWETLVIVDALEYEQAQGEDARSTAVDALQSELESREDD